jgi:hypothetical protein
MVTQGTHHPSHRFSQGMLQPKEVVHDYPLTSAFVMFGIGLGVGVLVGQALCEPISRSWHGEPTMTEKLGRSVVEALHSVLPEDVSRRILG